MTSEFPTDRPLTVARLPGDPTVSVVVTCYNYGHFLEACLESLYDQSWPANEIVVVDDGSSDASATVLRAHSDRIAVISKANGGQAAAFNAGFAATTGDIVLFLDADDLLDPVAVETICTKWADDLAVLNFGLRTVDASGRGIGVEAASMMCDEGDNRPLLLSSGTFSFPPTSGNAFSRTFLAAVLPMPEPRWRISADCYLIRAAALFGRFATVPRVLGSYRLHGGNNYALGPSSHANLTRRYGNDKDVADALLSLAKTPNLFADDPEDAKALSVALRWQAKAVLNNADAPYVPQAREYPSVAISHAEALLRLSSPRWPVHLPFNRKVVSDPTSQRPVLKQVIIPSVAPTRGQSLASKVLDFTVDPHPEMLLLKLHLAVQSKHGTPQPLLVKVDGTLAWHGQVDGDSELSIPVEPAHQAIRRRLRVEVLALGQDCNAIDVLELAVATDSAECLSPLLDAGGWRPIDEALGAALDPRDWKVEGSDTATLIGKEGYLRFSVLAAGANDLMLEFAGWPPVGSLIVSEDGQILFMGATGGQRTIILRLPGKEPPVGKHDLRIQFEADRNSATTTQLSFAAIGLTAHHQAQALPEPQLNIGETVHFEARRGRTHYLLGGWDEADATGTRNMSAEATLAFCKPARCAGLCLQLDLAPAQEPVPGVQMIVGVSLEGAMICAFALEGPGRVEVPIPDSHTKQVVRLVLHSAYLVAPRDNLANLASDDPLEWDGSAQSTAEPADPGPGVAAHTTDMSSVLALLELRSMTLQGKENDQPPRKPMARAGVRHDPSVRRLFDRATRVLSNDSPPSLAEVSGLQAEIADFIATCSEAACVLIAATPGAVELFARLGARHRQMAYLVPVKAKSGQGQSLPVSRMPSGLAGTDDKTAQITLRNALLAIVSLPSTEAPEMADFARLPPPLFWDVPALAHWLIDMPDIETEAAHKGYVAFLERLLTQVDRVLSREPPGSALFRLASQSIMWLRSTRMIFGSGNLRDLIRLRGRCIERLLTHEGAQLAMQRPPRGTTRRLRIGVMVRDVTPSPEGWALLGMYGSLDPRKFERVLIRLEAHDRSHKTDDIFDEELSLQGLDLASSVEAIRALDLDMFLTGAYAGEWEKAGLILAHRLAPVQIWPGAVCPTTNGFRSFDLVLSARITEPDLPERMYMQPLAWIDGPLQAVYAFPEPAAANRADLRKALFVKRGQVLLTSGAMAHKITDALLAAWAAILVAAPKAVLVLYPFAPNWSMAFAEDRLRDRIDQKLAELGVDPDRVKLLATQSAEGVGAILQAADLYLDSFPYTGATTVCEALSRETPVVTLAGDSLRALTGASWVRAFGLPELVARTVGDYVACAGGLAADPAALATVRSRLKDRLTTGAPPHCDTASFGPAFSQALLRVATTSGKFPAFAERSGLDMAVVDRSTPPARRSPAIMLNLTPSASRFVVLANPRSGSSLLCHMLNATPGVRCHYELFQESMIEYFGETVRDPSAIASRDADPVGFMEGIYDKGRGDGYRIVGFKHMGSFSKAISQAVTADQRIKIIILRRANLLAKFSSLAIATKTKQWKVPNGQIVERPKVLFDIEKFARFERWENGMARESNDLLAMHRRDALFLEYTELRSKQTGRRLSEFLGTGLTWDHEIGLQRQNPGSIIDRFSNPDEVRAFLANRGTPEWADEG